MINMIPSRFHSKALLALLCLSFLTVGCTIQSVKAQGNGKARNPTPVRAPQCQQDNKARPIGSRFLFNGSETHYVQVLTEPADRQYARVVSDGIPVQLRFDAKSVGPVVYHPLGDRFAFIADLAGEKYIFEYANGGETPYFAEPIEDAWNNWVCFGVTGKYLFAIALHDLKWHLYAREEKPNAPFVRLALNGEPLWMELSRARADGSEGIQYELTNGPVRMQINSWLK